MSFLLLQNYLECVVAGTSLGENKEALSHVGVRTGKGCSRAGSSTIGGGGLTIVKVGTAIKSVCREVLDCSAVSDRAIDCCCRCGLWASWVASILGLSIGRQRLQDGIPQQYSKSSQHRHD
jgi:hypothetical protein